MYGADSSHNVTIISSVFQFTRSVAESPLITQLKINDVTAAINGTRLFCSTDGDTNNALMSRILVIDNIISKTIHIMYHNIYYHALHDYYNNIPDHPHPPCIDLVFIDMPSMLMIPNYI